MASGVDNYQYGRRNPRPQIRGRNLNMSVWKAPDSPGAVVRHSLACFSRRIAAMRSQWFEAQTLRAYKPAQAFSHQLRAGYVHQYLDRTPSRALQAASPPAKAISQGPICRVSEEFDCLAH